MNVEELKAEIKSKTIATMYYPIKAYCYHRKGQKQMGGGNWFGSNLR
jgi:hypothetical protein